LPKLLNKNNNKLFAVTDCMFAIEIIQQRGLKQAPENGKESSHSAHAKGMNE
jgi:hypothetical protein